MVAKEKRSVQLHYRYADPSAPHGSKYLFYTGLLIHKPDIMGKVLQIIRGASIGAENFKITPVFASDTVFLEFTESANKDDIVAILKQQGFIASRH